MMAPLRYQYSEGDLPIAAPAFVSEDSDSWWAGAQKCFVGVAVAAALAVFAFGECGIG